MGDYGHDLRFGVFITPSAGEPERVLALAALADESGLDLVTFQDHPYRPRFLDTWTLLSFVAARTSRVRLSANVLNLPLRPPAVVARAVASLDILSGGRAELGLGAGAFWDAIEAMGGRRLSPGQSVTALEEAIDVIRALWDVSQPRAARVNGSHHRRAGAARGPAPLHDVAIWIGAYKPRMLDLVGRRADGWLPSRPPGRSPRAPPTPACSGSARRRTTACASARWPPGTSRRARTGRRPVRGSPTPGAGGSWGST